MTDDLAKIKLIYEFNPNSPLFARVAEAELNAGNINRAIEILEKGLEIFPDYTSGKLVYIEALAKKGEIKKVIEKLDELRPKLEDDSAINYYLEKIEEERSSHPEDEEEIQKPFESDLDNLAEKISKAKIPPINDENKTEKKEYSNSKGNQFISETLADIYFSQANYKEALDIYEKLLESNPQKSDHFEQKIREIKEAMNK